MQREMVLRGAGAWTLKGGNFYDSERGLYILKCRNCKKLFYGRIDAITCGDTCRQQKARKEASSVGYARRSKT